MGVVLGTSAAHSSDAWVCDSRVLAFKNYSRLWVQGVVAAVATSLQFTPLMFAAGVGSADFKFCGCCCDSLCFPFRPLLIYWPQLWGIQSPLCPSSSSARHSLQWHSAASTQMTTPPCRYCCGEGSIAGLCQPLRASATSSLPWKSCWSGPAVTSPDYSWMWRTTVRKAAAWMFFSILVHWSMLKKPTNQSPTTQKNPQNQTTKQIVMLFCPHNIYHTW